MNAHALSKSQFVGDWKCTTYDKSGKDKDYAITYDTINADGSMSQLWEVVSHKSTGALLYVEYMTIKNRWRVKGDRLYIYDFKVVDYLGFDDKKIPYDEEYQAFLKQTWSDSYQSENSKVKFINKDHFVLIKEKEDDFDTECVRFKKEGV